MMDAITMQDLKSAELFMNSLPRTACERGERYFAQGRVLGIQCETPGAQYRAEVRGGSVYEVYLSCDDGGWEADCSCPMEFDCKHVYAAMRALIRTYSNGGAASPGPGSSAGKRQTATASSSAPAKDGPLAERVAAALGRELRPAETGFLNKLREISWHCRQYHVIYPTDFAALGFPLKGYSWEALHIWPAAPKDDHEFWLYVAHHARQKGFDIPEFMLPVTDLAAVAERIRKWHRAREVERWQELLRQERILSAPSSRGTIDLRVCFDEQRAALDWKREGAEAFEPMKQNLFHQLGRDEQQGLVAFTPEGTLIWHLFMERYGSRPTEVNYTDPEADAVLGPLLRLPVLRERLVNAEGEPLRPDPEPLRWQLTPAQDEGGDYAFRLVRADGSPLTRMLVAVAGRPPVYVTATAIFTGPPVEAQLLDPKRENRMPAPALESREGVRFLDALGIELPPRLRERVRKVPLRVRIACALKALYPGANTENCTIKVTAVDDRNKEVERWSPAGWGPASYSIRPPKQAAVDGIVLHDRSALAQVPRLMASLNPKWDSYTQQYCLRLSKRFADDFAAWLKSLPPEVEVELQGELASLTSEAVAGKVRLDLVEVAVDWFDLSVVLDPSDTELTPAELKLLLAARGRFVRLKDKGWRRLQFDLEPEDDERLARLGLSTSEFNAEPQRLHALQLADDAARKFLPAEQADAIRRRAAEIKVRVTPKVPAVVTAQLRPYQREGFHFLAYLSANRFGGVLADDMGLGKTIEALTWLAWLRDEAARQTPAKPAAPALVVCPKSVMDNWRAEVERFTPGLRVKVWSAREAGQLVRESATADLHVLNYSQLRLVGESLGGLPFLAVILDEGQYIKNPNSQTAQIARALRAEHRLVLSGTPIENRLLDLWSLMAFAMPGVLGSRAQFARLYNGKDDPLARRRLAARVRPFLLRRTKAQVAADLPDRVEEDLYCEIEGEQKTLYRAELKHAQQMLLNVKTQKQLAKERFHFLTSLLRLRQICCDPRLVKPDSKAASAKVEALLEQLEPLMEEGQKVLVFSQFVTLLELLRPLLSAKGWPLHYLCGETENRGEVVRDFQSADGAAVFLLSLKAGGFGLNLTAASYVVLFDPWWNPAVENQAIDRTHRIGQVNKVMAYRLLIKGSIEEKIRQLQKQKSALADDVLGEEKFAQGLSLEDLQFLFAD